jgi:hypothetical protein
MDYVLREDVDCESCGFPAPTGLFARGPGTIQVPEQPLRPLCEFCATTMAGRHTEYRALDPITALEKEVWRVGANVFNMLKFGGAK